MTDSHSSKSRPKVIILGAGFAGLNAAKALGSANVDVTVIDRNNHHTFHPLLYQVALAVLSPGDIAQPIRSILSNHKNVEVLMDEACQIDVVTQTVSLKTGITLPYDFLIVATGSTHSYFGKEEWAAIAPGLKTIEDATEIRRRVLLAYELAERQMVETGSHTPLKFVIIGGGPTGVELAGAISDIAHLYMLRDFRHIDTSSTEVCILEGSASILATYPEELRRKAVQQLEALGVQVRTGFHVTDVGPGYVMVGSERIESACTLWAAGVQGSPLGRMLGLDVDRRGRVPVDQFLNPEGLPNVFVCGDLAYLEQDGMPIPGVAQPAMQMGAYTGRRIRHLARTAEVKNFPAFRYFDKGNIATIGRKAAVAEIRWPFRAYWSGLLAWLTWMGVHIFFLIGFRNRISVFASWAHTYIRLRDGVRLIVGSRQLPGWGTVRKELKAAPELEACPAPEQSAIESTGSLCAARKN
ncbi:NAD(P)/FAD-dependent oxidoreductase [Edaphobacter sp. 12200R-103]|uniref:NAD(P)/FAD-dependent oxidoreductase n=1 Tax=Edaphobacter sp. 12200R-103 TaxID=2703788 RepID=UPI00138C4DB3|nr:NAD(P)/FAD-dependent oxidoreductase [Edaphobacter sp. 12200R-103]QHS50436.1 NAD(P)/FAD-dependent oxidoreductase [Edaphobacter sp. 12200R-103]